MISRIQKLKSFFGGFVRCLGCKEVSSAPRWNPCFAHAGGILAGVRSAPAITMQPPTIPRKVSVYAKQVLGNFLRRLRAPTFSVSNRGQN